MAILHILRYPHPGLREKAKPIQTFDNTISTLAEDMLETMYDAPGIGLAATQIGSTKQLLVLDVSEDRNSPFVIINPEIIEKSDESINEEGCLSFPGVYANVPRAEKITVKYHDLEGKEKKIETDGILAICIQHEMDHLKGKVFVDYLSALKRNRIRKQLEKAQREKQNEQQT